MLKKIDITNFGSFCNFTWNNEIRDAGRNVQEFKKLNIIYGRNYTGKTTLSRIVRSLEVRSTPENYSDPNFSIELESGSYDQKNIDQCAESVRVYNEDFRRDNLSFLENSLDGEIAPFAIIGQGNVETEKKIKGIMEILGSRERDTGLLGDSNRLEENERAAKLKTKTQTDSLKKMLTEHANKTIKKEPLFQEPIYNITRIKSDIEKIELDKISPLDTKQKAELTAILNGQILSGISENVNFVPKIGKIISSSNAVLTRKIVPTAPIQKLLNDVVLQSWVHQGIGIHKNKSENCGFCGNVIPKDLWKKLDGHFNHELENLVAETQNILTEIDIEIKDIRSLLPPLDGSRFYSSIQEEYLTLRQSIQSSIEVYVDELEKLKTSLISRRKDIYNPFEKHTQMYFEQDLLDLVEKFNDLVQANNARTDAFFEDQKKARQSLKLDNIHNFMSTIGYSSLKKEIAKLEREEKGAEEKKILLEAKIKEERGKLDVLQSEISDEQKAVAKINQYLSNFFGHENLLLERNTDSDGQIANSTFQITRNSEIAFNLSEGERSLISICYFVAKLSESTTNIEDSIIFIDDPISSLDSNHIFFVFSLIESIIAKPIRKAGHSNVYRYKQLFISTHNLDFLKYLKRLSMPKKDFQFFMVERKSSESKIKLMPEYLKKYTTEFIYLFEQIYICSDRGNAATNSHSFYSFGNNLRKFLEAHLYFKFPHTDDKNNSLERFEKFFGTNELASNLINRLVNEMSHLESNFDRSAKPIDIDEISKIAGFVLEKLKENDIIQYESLLKAIQ